MEEFEEEKEGREVVLTAPLSVESKGYWPPNIIQRLLGLFSNVQLGSNLTTFQLLPQFNIPKSQLQCYGEAVYSLSSDLFSRCMEEEALDRFVAVVAWSISTVRPLPFGLAPYNPVLGETHHVSQGTLNVLLEQVSHHPPVTALHATDEKRNLEIVWCQSPVPNFYGTHVQTEVHGKRWLRLLDRNETYTTNSPNLVIRFLPVPRVDWLGNVTVCCQQTGLTAELCYSTTMFLPHRSVKGKIFRPSTLETIYEINGQWDRTIKAKNVSTGETKVIYDAKEALHGLMTPIVKDSKGVSESESTVIWGEVSRAILERNWEKAKEAKTSIEERQRELARGREVRQEHWVPKHFTLSHSKESGWDCWPKKQSVHAAPIVIDHDMI